MHEVAGLVVEVSHNLNGLAPQMPAEVASDLHEC